MIVVDSSVWINNLRNAGSPSAKKLMEITNPRHIIVGDLVLLEVLQGAQNHKHAEIIFSLLSNTALNQCQMLMLLCKPQQTSVICAARASPFGKPSI